MIQEELSGEPLLILFHWRPLAFISGLASVMGLASLDTHVAQMLGYLNIIGLDLALLLNFKNARLEWKRVLRPREAGEHDTPDLHG